MCRAFFLSVAEAFDYNIIQYNYLLAGTAASGTL